MVVPLCLALAACGGHASVSASVIGKTSTSVTTPHSGGSPASTEAGATTSAPSAGTGSPTTEAPQPAGPKPSPIAKEICVRSTQEEISSVIGVDASVSTPDWTDHLYSCGYTYPHGTVVLSVKELSSWDQTYSYFDGLGQSLGDTGSIGDLGQGAFTTRDGSVVVRKDFKVLLVDISRLTGKVGDPLIPPSQVALTDAAIILACWAGD